MKAILKNTIILPSLALFAAVAFTACSDWTETESLDIKQPDIENDNPELYAKYLENLRAYKQGDHKLLYVTFDNSRKTPVSQAHHINSLPDSVDYISLEAYDNLVQRELQEIEQVRRKGTQVVYTVSIPSLEIEYRLAKIDYEENADFFTPEFPDFRTWLAPKLDEALACMALGYDGITLHNNGRSSINMTPAELADYKATEELILSKVRETLAAYPGKSFIFRGYPQNLLDKTILSEARCIILPTESANAIGALSVEATMASVRGVPTDRFVVAVNTVSLDAEDVTTGYFTTGRAVTEAAYWAAADAASYTKAGIAILSVQNDYYNRTLVYRYSREAAAIMNPSPKN